MQKFRNLISEKKLAIISIFLLCVSVMPLLILGKFNVMSADDYSYGIGVHDTWAATGSLLQAIRSAVSHTKEFYYGWQGTYTSCFLMSMCPMHFGIKNVFVVPVIMIGMFSLSTYLLVRQIFVRWFGGDRTSYIYVGCILLFLYWQVLEAPSDGIYWYNGATHYVLMQAFLFLMITAVSGIIWTECERNRIVWCILASLDGVVIGGGNLVTCLQAQIILLLLMLYSFLKKRKKSVYVLIPLLCFTAGFMVNIAAPGNSLRSSASSEGYSALASIIASFYYAFIYIGRWTSIMVVLVWLSAVPIMWGIVQKSEKKFAYPALVTAGVFCLIAAMFTPSLYAIGQVGQERINNIIQMVYYLGLFSVTAYWFGWLTHRKKLTVFSNLFEKYGNILSLGCIAVFITVWIFTADKNTYAGISALRSLVKGDAAVFYEEEMERYEMYTDEEIKDVVVKTHSVRPYVFDSRDVSWDVDHWINVAMAHYYHKNSIMRLIDTDS